MNVHMHKTSYYLYQQIRKLTINLQFNTQKITVKNMYIAKPQQLQLKMPYLKTIRVCLRKIY